MTTTTAHPEIIETEINNALFYNSHTWQLQATRIIASNTWSMYIVNCEDRRQAEVVVDSIMHRPALVNNYSVETQISCTLSLDDDHLSEGSASVEINVQCNSEVN